MRAGRQSGTDDGATVHAAHGRNDRALQSAGQLPGGRRIATNPLQAVSSVPAKCSRVRNLARTIELDRDMPAVPGQRDKGVDWAEILPTRSLEPIGGVMRRVTTPYIDAHSPDASIGCIRLSGVQMP